MRVNPSSAPKMAIDCDRTPFNSMRASVCAQSDAYAISGSRRSRSASGSERSGRIRTSAGRLSGLSGVCENFFIT